MEELRKRNYRQIAYAIQTLYFHYTGNLVGLDDLEKAITQDDEPSAERELKKLLRSLTNEMIGSSRESLN